MERAVRPPLEEFWGVDFGGWAFGGQEAWGDCCIRSAKSTNEPDRLWSGLTGGCLGAMGQLWARDAYPRVPSTAPLLTPQSPSLVSTRSAPSPPDLPPPPCLAPTNRPNPVGSARDAQLPHPPPTAVVTDSGGCELVGKPLTSTLS